MRFDTQHKHQLHSLQKLIFFLSFSLSSQPFSITTLTRAYLIATQIFSIITIHNNLFMCLLRKFTAKSLSESRYRNREEKKKHVVELQNIECHVTHRANRNLPNNNTVSLELIFFLHFFFASILWMKYVQSISAI